MRQSEMIRAEAVATAILGDAHRGDVLHNSNKLTLRLGDLVARIAPADQQNAQFEVDLALRLAEAGSPVAVPLPEIHERDGFVITFWPYYEPQPPAGPHEYADALKRLHAGMRTVDLPTPHYTDRIAEARRLVAAADLPDADRELLTRTLQPLQTGEEQLLHGEPHPGNVLSTRSGLLFIDLETCCRGPVEFDLAHAPEEVAGHYPGADPDLLKASLRLMLAMIVAWRYDPLDELPDGPQRAADWLNELRRSSDADGLPKWYP